MNVTVFVPTHRRAGPLVWSLGSVLLQRFPTLSVARARLVVLNNDADRAPVERALAEALNSVDRGPWEVEVVHRDPPMSPIDNWYGGIREFAAPDDFVFLHGDDDLMLRGSAEVRVRAHLESGAEMLVTRSVADRLIFDGPGARRAWIEGPGTLPPSAPMPARRPALGELVDFGLAFITAHNYRPTPLFWEAYDYALARLHTLPIRGTQQVAMLPYFLGIELARRSALAVCDAVCTARGFNTQEIVGLRFGESNWRSGVLYGLSMLLLERGDFGPRAPLDPLIVSLRRVFANWYLPTMSSPDTRAMLRDLGLDDPRQFGPGDARDLLPGVSALAKGVLGAQNLVSRLRGWGRPWDLPQLMRTLEQDGSARPAHRAP